jgi:hypothetical protein
MNTENNFVSIFPSSSFGFHNNHQEFNEDGTTNMSSSTSLDNQIFKNNHFPSIMVNDDQQDTNTSEDKGNFHRKLNIYFFIPCIR